MASHQYDHHAPEVVQQSIPEVYYPQSAVSTSYYSQGPDTIGSPAKTESATLHPGYTPSPVNDTHSQEKPNKAKRTFCGCTVLVLVLSIIIAVLAAAVIGLAVGTGVQSNRANDANEKLSALSASGPATQTVTVPAAGPTDIGYASITHGCSDEDEKTTATNYTTHFLNKVTFTMFCNANAPPYDPLMALAVPDFDSCMDACASYTKYTSASFDSDNVNATCTAVSFIPGWTARESAIRAKAEGNCYLKSGPQTRSKLEPVERGDGETHAAIVSDS